MSQPAAWTEVRVIAPVGWQELIAEQLMSGPCTTAAFGRPNLGVDPAPEGHDFVRVFLSRVEDTPEARLAIEQRLRGLAELCGEPELASLEVDFRELPPVDYATAWRKTWRPFRVGPLCLLPPWEERELRDGEQRLTIEPGGSFGSGRHATTRTCLRVLTRRIQGGERVLDAGTGSGLLSVAAVMLGAEQALGFDIDPNSAVAAGDLARDNGAERTCEFRTGGFEVLLDGEREFDVVLANIYSDVIQERALELAQRLAPDGWFAFSGCPDIHHDTTRAAIEGAGLHIEEPLRRGRWHTFVGRHR